MEGRERGPAAIPNAVAYCHWPKTGQNGLARRCGRSYSVPCNQSDFGQNGQENEPTRGSESDNRRLDAVPVEELRAFAKGLSDAYTLRRAARMLAMKREALRKIVRGETATPHPATRRKIARAMLAARSDVRAVAEVAHAVEAPNPVEMKVIFATREEAYRHFDEQLQAFRDAHPGDAEGIARAEAVRAYLRRTADAAFAAGPGLYDDLRRRNAPGSGLNGDSPPGETEDDEEYEEDEETGSDDSPSPE